MKKYRKYLFILIIIIINIGFILTFVSKHNIHIELVESIDYILDDAAPHFEIETKVISGFNEPRLVAYGRRVKKMEYSPVYLFADDWGLLRDRWKSDMRTFDYTFFNCHPYYIEYEEEPNKIFIYRLPPEYLGVNGSIHVITDSK
ncbi:MAG: hypothetical protein K2J10_03955 [Muribaculaceae bacterium]|nr:hypothetical protein [Muribaculaceae bacterium]